MKIIRVLLIIFLLIGFNGYAHAIETDSVDIYISKKEDLKALKFAIAQSEKLLQNKSYKNLCNNKLKQSRIYLRLNDSKKSTAVLFYALKIAEQQNLKLEQVVLLNEIAKNFELARNKTRAIYYFKKGGDIALSIPNDTIRVFTSQGLFSVYVQSGDYKNAKVYMQQIMKTFRKKGNTDQQYRAHSNYSNYYFAIKDYTTGKKHLDTALAFAKINNKEKFLNVCYSNFGYYYMVVEKDFKKGEQQYLKMLALGSKDPYSMNNADTYLNLSYAYEQMGNFKKANECLNKYIEYSAIVFENRLNAQLRDADTKYAIDNVEKEYKQKQIVLEQTQSKNQKIFIVIIALLILIAILFYFFNQNSRLKEKNKFKDIESKIQQKIINASIDGQEIERKKIAGVLHDSISAQLSSAGLHLSAFSATTNSNSEEIAKTRAILKEAHDKVRDLSHELLPTLLAKFGLLYALQDLCEKNSNSLLEFKYESDISIRNRYNEEFEMKVYFIIAELMNNVHKHSKADHAKLILAENGNELHISIKDNGKGFDTAKSQKIEGFGLTQIRARMANMKGKFIVDSKPGHGTIITLNIPIPQ